MASFYDCPLHFQSSQLVSSEVDAEMSALIKSTSTLASLLIFVFKISTRVSPVPSLEVALHVPLLE